MITRIHYSFRLSKESDSRLAAAKAATNLNSRQVIERAIMAYHHLTGVRVNWDGLDVLRQTHMAIARDSHCRRARIR